MNAISESCMRVIFFLVRLYQIAIIPNRITFVDAFFAHCQMYFELTKSQKENENNISIESNFEHVLQMLNQHGWMYVLCLHFFPAVIDSKAVLFLFPMLLFLTINRSLDRTRTRTQTHLSSFISGLLIMVEIEFVRRIL